MKAYTFAAHRLHLAARPVPVATAILAAAATQSGADPMSLQAVVEASQNGQLGSAEDVKKMVFNAVRKSFVFDFFLSTWYLHVDWSLHLFLFLLHW